MSRDASDGAESKDQPSWSASGAEADPDKNNSSPEPVSESTTPQDAKDDASDKQSSQHAPESPDLESDPAMEPAPEPTAEPATSDSEDDASDQQGSEPAPAESRPDIATDPSTESKSPPAVQRQPSNRMVPALLIAVAAAAFFAGHSASIFMDQPEGLSDEQLELILSKIDNLAIPASDEAGPDSAQAIRISLDDDPIKGNPDAELTIIEFSDFQCPFCARFYDQTLPLIEQEYISTGKVNFVYRDFPLQIHQNAVPAHMAAECADEQGAFWPYHDVLFEMQKEWESVPSEAIVAILVQYAHDLGLDATSLESCLSSAALAEEIQNDYQDGVQYGVRGTPAFFIGNESDGYVLISGAQPFAAFQNAIESGLG